MAQVINVFNDKISRNFSVRLVIEGDCYGKDMKLLWSEKSPIIEFYDASYDFVKDDSGLILGQFVSSYYHDTIMEIDEGIGLTLDISEKDIWVVDSDSIGLIQKWSCDVIQRTFVKESL